MIKELISLYGKNKINTLTKYPSILTLHQLGEKCVLKDELTTPIQGEELFATEKIDGTNVRIICYGDEFLIGSRDFILHHSSDLYFDPVHGIVDGIKNLGIEIPPSTKKFTVIYGELYGGKITKNSKWYGTDKIGFRVFDIAVYDDLSILEKTLPEISNWREKEREEGIIYGQKFLTREQIEEQFSYHLVPLVNFELGDMTHETILNNLEKYVPTTKVALSENSLNKCEGVVLRNADRTKIVKIRFEDYQRTLRFKKENQN